MCCECQLMNYEYLQLVNFWPGEFYHDMSWIAVEWKKTFGFLVVKQGELPSLSHFI